MAGRPMQSHLTGHAGRWHVERIGEPVYVLDGERTNFKITVPEDVWLAEALIRDGRVP